MNRAHDRGSESQHDEAIVPSPGGEISTSSGTVDYSPLAVERAAGESSSSLPQAAGGGVPAGGEAAEDDKTVISQRPVAAPEEFYRSMPLAELAQILEGHQLDHFLVEQMIGGGGMGAVFRGRDLRLDRVVAIKVIPASKRDPETLRRFRLEAQAAAKLDHPNIARVYNVGEAEQWNYIVFEFIDGVNIRDLVDIEGPLSVDDAVYYTRQVAEALQHAHERNVVHRDVKPSNVLVTASGAAKVVDMGLARSTALDKSTTDATASGVTLGTFDYISPEQARNPRDADVRSDLYSLGCTLFYMLTGNAPFPDGTALQKLLSHGSQPPPDPRNWRDDLSDQLYAITMKLMAKRPSDRYQKPEELISDLILLAEIEDLPRSQAPGTLLVTPTIAQRSLLETNLPWLVAFAFLMGSTLWLQSVQSLSGELTLTELDFKTRQEVPREPFAEGGKNTASAPPGSGEPAEKTNDALKPTLPEVLPQDLPSASPTSSLENSSEFRQPMLGGTLVVSDERPSDVDPKLWVETLTEALLRTAARSDLQEIEIRGRQVLHGPLHFQRHHLRIRGGSRTATLQLSEQALLAHDQGEGIFDLQDSQLTLAGLSLEVTLPLDVPLAMEGLFYVAGNSQLELDNCLVTINDRSQANGFFVVRCGGPSEPSNPPSAVPLSGLNDASPTLSDAMLIRLDTSVVRGETNFLSWEVTAETLNERLDISLNDTLLAISGSVLKLKSPTGDSQAQRFARLLCSQSTFVSEQPFAQLEYEGNAAPLLGLMRTSQSCIYWSRPQVPHVRISGARRQSLLGNFNLLLLQGVNNLYDANIEDVCQGFLGAERMVTFGFAEAYSSGWLGERGNEARVRWQSPPVPQLPLHDARPADFAVSDVLFVPGITPDNLPRPTF